MQFPVLFCKKFLSDIAHLISVHILNARASNSVKSIHGGILIAILT